MVTKFRKIKSFLLNVILNKKNLSFFLFVCLSPNIWKPYFWKMPIPILPVGFVDVSVELWISNKKTSPVVWLFLNWAFLLYKIPFKLTLQLSNYLHVSICEIKGRGSTPDISDIMTSCIFRFYLSARYAKSVLHLQLKVN